MIAHDSGGILVLSQYSDGWRSQEGGLEQE